MKTLAALLALSSCAESSTGSVAERREAEGGAGGKVAAQSGSGGVGTAGGAAAGGAQAGGSPSTGGSVQLGAGGGLNSIAGGSPTGPRCDDVEACRSVAESCSKTVSAKCGATDAGTFGCGNEAGWFTADGYSFACVRSDGGLDCNGAMSAFVAHCSSLTASP